MLTSNMFATVKYWHDRVTCIAINYKLQEMDPKDQYKKGVRCVLQHLKLDAELQHTGSRALEMFARVIYVPAEKHPFKCHK